jgi:enoyl-[acyl-carrier protein] reductase II
MGFVAHAELASAVSNAGGLGCIGSTSMSARELSEQIHRCRDLTDRPFGVDILFAEIKADKNNPTVVRYASNVQKLIDITFEEKVPIIVSGLGNPAGIVPQRESREWS